MRETIEVAFALNEDYIAPWETALYSIVQNTRSSIRAHVLHAGISPENQKKIQQFADACNVRLAIHSIDPSWLGNFPDSPFYPSKETYLRIKLPSLLNDCERCIYLDADVSVCDNLAELWEYNLRGGIIGAVKDIDIDFLREHLKQIQFGPQHTYCNAGVLLMDLEKLRSINFESLAIDFAQKCPERVKIVDQDIINILLCESVTYLPLKWNVTVFWVENWNDSGRNCWKNVQAHYSESERKSAMEQPAIVHFANVIKPWHLSMEAMAHPFYKSYRDSYRLASRIGNKRINENSINCDMVFVAILDRLSVAATAQIWKILKTLSSDSRVALISDACPGEVHELAANFAAWDDRVIVISASKKAPSLNKKLKHVVRNSGARRFAVLRLHSKEIEVNRLAASNYLQSAMANIFLGYYWRERTIYRIL